MEICRRVSEGSINLAHPSFDVPNQQSRWTVGFNGTSIKGGTAGPSGGG
ncbi:MAG: hypothetical protein J6S81_00085 [Treponema sp.]|nr:hypothetical protein [Treponema sp.]